MCRYFVFLRDMHALFGAIFGCTVCIILRVFFHFSRRWHFGIAIQLIHRFLFWAAGNSSSFPAHPVSNAGSRKQDPLDDQHSISIHALPSKVTHETHYLLIQCKHPLALRVTTVRCTSKQYRIFSQKSILSALFDYSFVGLAALLWQSIPCILIARSRVGFAGFDNIRIRPESRQLSSLDVIGKQT